MSSAVDVVGAGRSVHGSPRASARSPRPDTPTFHLDLRDRRLLVLFEIAAAERATTLAPSRLHADWVVTDAIPLEAGTDRLILVLVDASPLACRTAVDLVEQRLIAAVLTPDRAALLEEVARLAEVGQASLPAEVVAQAAHAPEITSRQREVLRLVTRGWSNLDVADRMHVSSTTIKRDVSDLLRAFDCRNRRQLRAAAQDLGLV